MSQTPTTAERARDLGLRKVGGRPPLGAYVTQVWERRYFALSLARGKAFSHNQGGYLGQLWAILTPLLWAVLYFAVFGMLLHTSKGIDNFAGFLVTGLFLIRFVTTSISHAAGSIQKNNTLITSLQFPRALIPISIATTELLLLLPALVVLYAVAFIGGEPLRWQMVLLFPAVALAYLFAIGASLVSARVVHEVADLGNLIPFFNRLLFYTSGVFFSLDRYGQGWFGAVMRHQPFAVYLELGRSALLEEHPTTPVIWLWGLGWSVLFLVLGMLFFWRAEAKYGRG